MMAKCQLPRSTSFEMRAFQSFRRPCFCFSTLQDKIPCLKKILSLQAHFIFFSHIFMCTIYIPETHAATLINIQKSAWLFLSCRWSATGHPVQHLGLHQGTQGMFRSRCLTTRRYRPIYLPPSSVVLYQKLFNRPDVAGAVLQTPL